MSYPYFRHYPLVYPPHPIYVRPFPKVDPSFFRQSAAQMEQLLKDGEAIVSKVAQSESFAKQLLDAAQLSHTEQVHQLIKSAGITSDFKTSFNPDGIHVQLKDKVGTTDCCVLTIVLGW